MLIVNSAINDDGANKDPKNRHRRAASDQDQGGSDGFLFRAVAATTSFASFHGISSTVTTEHVEPAQPSGSSMMNQDAHSTGRSFEVREGGLS